MATTSYTADGRAAAHPDDNEDDEEPGESDGDESDTSSLLLDILNSENENSLDTSFTIRGHEAATLKDTLKRQGPNEFIRDTVTSGRYTAKRLLTLFDIRPPDIFEGREDDGYYRLLGLAIVRFLTSRQKLPQYNTMDDVVALLKTSRRVMVITGAGISTSLGIPDFRSANTGFYDQMRAKGLESAEAIFRFDTFKEDPSIFYENSGKMLPELGKSTPTHAFIKLLDDKDKLLTNYTQNIDDIEGNVGISREKLIQCHGSWAYFKCLTCQTRLPGKQFYDQVRAGSIVYCVNCHAPPTSLKRKRSSAPSSRSHSRRRRTDDDDDDDNDPRDGPSYGVMKPEITFFGERLPDPFFRRFQDHDRDVVDLVIVIGTSLTVAPVSEIPLALDGSIPHIYISRDRAKHINFDVTLLGDCDVIVEELSKRLKWDLHHHMLRHQDAQAVEEDHEAAVWRVSPKAVEDGKPSVGEVRKRIEVVDLDADDSPEPEKV